MKLYVYMKLYGYVCFALLMLVFSWEMQYAAAAPKGTIPEDAIRIRILAHSDSPMDQWLKRKVTDAVSARLNDWTPGLRTAEEARSLIRAKLDEINRIVGEEVRRYGFSYGYQVELAAVPFPEKVFFRTHYDAGNYETLLITLGEGKGSNWWCVLFPPLCFADLISESKVEAQTEGPSEDSERSPGEEVIKYRFFIFEAAEKVVQWFHRLW